MVSSFTIRASAVYLQRGLKLDREAQDWNAREDHMKNIVRQTETLFDRNHEKIELVKFGALQPGSTSSLVPDKFGLQTENSYMKV